jgi:hypothetical protein
MAVYGIGDLHLDFSKKKPMDVFGDKWVNHEEKIFENWVNTVKEEDIVLIPGDISWAMKIDDAKFDLLKIERLPGKKIISKGNHDYWWETKKKLNSLGLKTIHFLHNDSYIYRDVGISGTRGWAAKDSDEFSKHDEKVFNREVNRLNLSLESINKNVYKKIVMLHYPPFNVNGTPNEFVNVMKEHNVDICIYGHLHSDGHIYVVEGIVDGIEFHCVSSDYINFKPRNIL